MAAVLEMLPTGSGVTRPRAAQPCTAMYLSHDISFSDTRGNQTDLAKPDLLSLVKSSIRIISHIHLTD